MRYLVSIPAVFLALTIFVACENKLPVSTTSDNEKIVKQYFELFNSHQWKQMAEMYTDTAAFKDPSLGQGIVRQTRQEVINKYTELGNTFPNIHDEIISIYPSGEKHIIVEFVSKGTAPDSSVFELPICTVFTIENGKITKDFTYYDNWDDAAAADKK